MAKHRSLALLILFIGVSAWESSDWARADEIQRDQTKAKLIIDPSAPTLPGLKWSSLEPPVKIRRGLAGPEVSVVLTGHYQDNPSDLRFQNKKVEIESSGDFQYEFPVDRKATTLTLTSTDQTGKIEVSSVGILLEDFPQILGETIPYPPKPWALSAGLSATYVQYSQPSHSISSIASTGKFSISYFVLPSKLDLGLSAYYTSIPFTGVGADQLYFLGVNLRVGYVVQGISEPWRLSIMTGIYSVGIFTPTLNTGSQFFLGPQLFPVLRRALPGNRAVSGYFKFSPVLTGSGGFSLSNREIAFGGAYSIPLSNGHPLIFSNDISTLKLSLPSGDVADQTYSVGIGYGF